MLDKILPVIIASCMLAAVPAPAAAQDAAPTAAPKGDRKICKRVGEAIIGSRFGKAKVCKTAAQWEKQRQAEQGRKASSSDPKTSGSN